MSAHLDTQHHTQHPLTPRLRRVHYLLQWILLISLAQLAALVWIGYQLTEEGAR